MAILEQTVKPQRLATLIPAKMAHFAPVKWTVMVIQDTPVNVPLVIAGTNCEEDINECDPDPCQNGATCTETSDGTIPAVGVYHCECVAGFEGYACHIEIPCDTNPCQNGATCSEIVSTDPPPTYTIIGNQNTCSSRGDGYRGLTADECENVPNTVSMTLYGDGLGNHTYGACAYNGMGGTMLGVIDDIQTDLCFFVTCACLKPVSRIHM